MRENKLSQPPRSGMPAVIVLLGATLMCIVGFVVLLSWVFA